MHYGDIIKLKKKEEKKEEKKYENALFYLTAVYLIKL